MDDDGETGGGTDEVPLSGTGTVIDVMAGIGSTPGPSVESTVSSAANGRGSTAEWMPNQDRPTATAVTTAQAARYPIDRLTATTLP